MWLRAGSRLLHTVASGVVDVLYPPVCAACGTALRPAAEGTALPVCRACWLALPVVGSAVCLRCGMPQGPHVGRVTRCFACPTDLGGIAETVALGRYFRAPSPTTNADEFEPDADESGEESLPQEHPAELGELAEAEAAPGESGESSEPGEAAAATGAELLRTVVLRLKYRGGLESARLLGGLLAGEVTARPWADELDWVVPVPLHWRRQLERRFNQADLIAAVLARRLGLVKLGLLQRTRHTDSQTTLPRLARAQNVNGAFRLVPRWRRSLQAAGSLRDRSILLVDDVLTTGATLRNCASVLRAAGAAKVYAAVAARASA